MRPEAKVQHRGERSAPDVSWLFTSSAMYVALSHWNDEKEKEPYQTPSTPEANRP